MIVSFFVFVYLFHSLPSNLNSVRMFVCASMCTCCYGCYCKPVFQVNKKRKYSLERFSVLFRYNCPVDQFRITFKKLDWGIMKQHTILYKNASTHKAKSACRYAFIAHMEVKNVRIANSFMWILCACEHSKYIPIKEKKKKNGQAGRQAGKRK